MVCDLKYSYFQDKWQILVKGNNCHTEFLSVKLNNRSFQKDDGHINLCYSVLFFLIGPWQAGLHPSVCTTHCGRGWWKSKLVALWRWFLSACFFSPPTLPAQGKCSKSETINHGEGSGNNLVIKTCWRPLSFASLASRLITVTWEQYHCSKYQVESAKATCPLRQIKGFNVWGHSC